MILLQQQLNPIGDLTRSTESLSNTTIQLAQAVSDYGALKVIFALFIVVVIIMIITMAFTLISNFRRMNKIEAASIKVLQYFDNLTNRTLGREESNAIVRETVNRYCALTKYNILRIRIENHIDNTEITKQKIDKLVENYFAELNSFLSRFICIDKPLSNIIDFDNVDSLKAMITQLVYVPKEEFTVSNMDQTVELYYSGIKIEYLKRLENL